MTHLSTIFKKPIDRHIEGVIKADDASSLRVEVEEYVITNEVAKRLETFLAAYNNYQGANGVWISGFFGSGKSHLLKMLALLLENERVDGQSVLDLFLAKQNVAENAFLAGELRKAAQIPSQSILFNIDQKATVISKQQIDALLAVFVQVFDEMSGYYGKQPHIAQFERDLDRRGQYDAFKQAYRHIAGQPWESGREIAVLEGPNIDAAYARAAGGGADAAQGILDKYHAHYRLSIEDFAEQVRAYIDRQGDGFRLNFYVDEVGQYIADNVKLMTNLQTIAESLATRCQGRAWLLVTAQEDMSTVVGEMGRDQGNDFSKIQARFANRMKLTSTDVAEVIRRRLLQKNAQGERLLPTLYEAQKANFRTFFDFTDGAQTYRNFGSEREFIDNYPFVPYQFVLFQAAIQNLSQHNAFEGKHSSVGERSMLGVFQQVAMQIAGRTLGELATFDLMFEGLRTALKSNLQRAILTAENHLGNPFAVQVLKALFLVKYIKEFRATPRNMAVLMLPSFAVDLAAHQRRVEEALNLLEQQAYVQRNGELYEYLTDEEKDVEQEIRATDVDAQAVADELGSILFDSVLRQRKIRYDENGQDYAFARKLDDRLLGRQHELTIHFITPFHEHAASPATVRAQAMGRDELLVILPPSDRLVRDLLMYKRTDKYVQHNLGTAQRDSTRRILMDRQVQNKDRLMSLRALVEELVGQATLAAGDHDLPVTSSDPQTRIVRAFHHLIERTYPNLRMLPADAYREEQIGSYLRAATTLLGGDAATFSEAEREVLATINRNQTGGLRTSLQKLVETFEQKPYGWYLAAIQCVTAQLLARGKLELRRDGNLLAAADYEQALRNTRGHANLLLEPQIDFTAGQVRQLRDFHADYFDGPPHANEAKALAQETAAAFAQLVQTLSDLRAQATRYPFLVTLDEPLARLRAVSGRPYTFYLTELRRQEDDLFADKERILTPLREFMGGARRTIYDDAQAYLQQQRGNLGYIASERPAQLAAVLNDPACYRGQTMQQAKTLLDALRAEVAAQVAQTRAEVQAQLAQRLQMLQQVDGYATLTAARQAELAQPFAQAQERLQQTDSIAGLRDAPRQFEEATYNALVGKLRRWLTPEAPATADAAAGAPEQHYIKESASVARRDLHIPFDKPWLEDSADVERYLAALRQALLRAIEDGKHITL